MNEANELKVGDRMRLSVALLKRLYDMPDHLSVEVTVFEVRVEEDGSKTLLVTGIEPVIE